MRTIIHTGVIIALSLLNISNSYARTDGQVVIGIVTDFKSIWSEDAGQGSLIAMELAVEDMGGELLGKPILILEGDHQLKADVAMNVVTEWNKNEGVDALFELSGSHIAIPVQTYAKEHGIHTFVSGAGSTKLSGEACSPYGYHWAWDVNSIMQIAPKLIREGRDKWYAIAADNAFGKGVTFLTQRALEANGGTLLGTSYHPVDQGNFKEEVAAAIRSGANVIAVSNGGEGADNVVRQIDEYGGKLNGQTVVSTLTSLNNLRRLGLNNASGLEFIASFYWNLNDRTKAFAKRFYKRHGGMPTMNQASVYSSTLHYLRAVKEAGTDEPNAVSRKVRTMKIDDPFAINGYIRDDGHMIHDVFAVTAKSPVESESAWDYLKILETIPGKVAFGADSDPKCDVAANKKILGL